MLKPKPVKQTRVKAQRFIPENWFAENTFHSTHSEIRFSSLPKFPETISINGVRLNLPKETVQLTDSTPFTLREWRAHQNVVSHAGIVLQTLSCIYQQVEFLRWLDSNLVPLYFTGQPFSQFWVDGMWMSPPVRQHLKTFLNSGSENEEVFIDGMNPKSFISYIMVLLHTPIVTEQVKPYLDQARFDLPTPLDKIQVDRLYHIPALKIGTSSLTATRLGSPGTSLCQPFSYSSSPHRGAYKQFQGKLPSLRETPMSQRVYDTGEPTEEGIFLALLTEPPEITYQYLVEDQTINWLNNPKVVTAQKEKFTGRVNQWCALRHLHRGGLRRYHENTFKNLLKNPHIDFVLRMDGRIRWSDWNLTGSGGAPTETRTDTWGYVVGVADDVTDPESFVRSVLPSPPVNQQWKTSKYAKAKNAYVVYFETITPMLTYFQENSLSTNLKDDDDSVIDF